ncbi:MAG: 50S ribosomal protein L24 [Eubacteriaceae bacterium]|nr:50S ribosomal protein L24 [Eubacteriaceae bacterium]
MHVKKGDIVEVIAGAREKDYKNAKDGKVTGKVLKVLPAQNRVVVEGVNLRKKHMKPTTTIQQGGIIEIEGSIHASNVLIYCPKCGKGVRTGSAMVGDKKVRVCKKCGETLDK